MKMLRRALSAALLSRQGHRHTAAEPDAILLAVGITVLAAILLGLGLMNVIVEGTRTPDVEGITDRLVKMWWVVITVLLGWVFWSVVVYLLGGKFLGGAATFRQTLRVLGTCYGPGVLGLFVLVPVAGSAVFLVGLFWILVAAIVATHEVQRTDWVAAILSTTFGWALGLVFIPLVFMPFAFF